MGEPRAGPAFAIPGCRTDPASYDKDRHRGKELDMNVQRKHLHWLIAAMIVCAAAATATLQAATADSRPESAGGGELRITGNLLDINANVHRSSQPFLVTIHHFSSESDLQALNSSLAGPGHNAGNGATSAYGVRDSLWSRPQDGMISVAGGLGYPVSMAVSQETPNGRTVRLYLNRQLGNREVQHYNRSSRYPFTYVEINLDKNGKGQGLMIAAAQLQPDGALPEVISLGSQPIRLLDVTAR
jgi:hypothetical protein